MRGVGLARLFGVVLGVELVAPGGMRMVGGLGMVAGLMMLGSLGVVVGSLGVMVGGGLVVVSGMLVRHGTLPGMRATRPRRTLAKPDDRSGGGAMTLM